MDFNNQEVIQDVSTKLQEIKNNVSNCYNLIKQGQEQSKYQLFFDLRNLLIRDGKVAIAVLEKVNTTGMLKMQKNLFNSTYQAALDWNKEIHEHYFDMRKLDDQDDAKNISDYHCATLYKLTQNYQEFLKFDQLFHKLSNQSNEEFYKYLECEGLGQNSRQQLANYNIGFKLFLQLEMSILKEELKFVLRERLIVKSILEQFGK